MSLYLRSYLTKDNLLIYNETRNLGKAPEVSLFVSPSQEAYSRYLFSIDITKIKEYYNNCVINDLDKVEHKIYIKTELLDDVCLTNGIQLNLYEVNEAYDQGCGNSLACDPCAIDKDCKVDYGPSNWHYRRFNELWTVSGAVDTISADIITSGYFELDNTNDYNIVFDVTDHINEKINLSGDIISFIMTYPNHIENNFNNELLVNLYTSEHPTYFKPFLETYYNNPLYDDRSNFHSGSSNTLFFRGLKNNAPVHFDENPLVNIYDTNEELVGTVSGQCVGYGFYKAVVTLSGDVDVCDRVYSDEWDNLIHNGVNIEAQTFSFFIKKNEDVYSFNELLFDNNNIKIKIRGITYDETIEAGTNKILYVDLYKNDFGKIKKIYADRLFYKLYLMQGANKFSLTQWIPLNQTFCQNWGYIDTSWMQSQKYYIDIKYQPDTTDILYEKVLKFQVKK